MIIIYNLICNYLIYRNILFLYNSILMYYDKKLHNIIQYNIGI